MRILLTRIKSADEAVGLDSFEPCRENLTNYFLWVADQEKAD